MPFNATHTISMDYRDRWSTQPEGVKDLLAGDKVQMIHNPGMGSIHVKKEDGTSVYVAGFAGHILKRID